MYTGKHNAVVTAECPYFIAETRYTISCEGFCSGCRTILRFDNEKLKDDHIFDYCTMYPNGCAVSEMNEKELQ